MSRVLVRKAEFEAPQFAATSGGGIGMVMPTPSWSTFDPEKYKDMGYTKDEIDAAKRWHTVGNIGRGAAAGLGALNAVYDQTSSGEPGVFNAAVSGGYRGLSGTQGLSDFAAEWGARRARAKNMKNQPEKTPPRPLLAEPTLNNTNETVMHEGVDFYENEPQGALPENRMLPAPPTTASPTGDSSNPPWMDAMTSAYGRENEPPWMSSLRRWDTGEQ